MNKSQAERNIKLFYVFTMVREPIFWGTVIIEMISRVSNMSQSEINFMEAICIITSVFLEIPTGALADHIGRKKMMLFGTILLLGEVFIFSGATTKTEVWIANLLAFAGYSCLSGSDSALIMDSLRFLGREKEHKQILYRSGAAKYFLVACCALLTGKLAEINIRLPGYLSLLPLLAGVLVILMFTEPPYAGHDKYEIKKHICLMIKGILYVARHKRIIWCICFIVMTSIVGKIWFFTYNPYFNLVGLNYTNYGQIFCLLNVVAGVCSLSSRWLQKPLGVMGSLILAVACLALPLMIMGAVVLPVCAYLVVFQNIVRGYFDPFIKDLYQKHLRSETRSTVASVQSACVSLGQCISMLIFSWMLKCWSLPMCLLALAMFALLAGTTLILAHKKIFASN